RGHGVDHWLRPRGNRRRGPADPRQRRKGREVTVCRIRVGGPAEGYDVVVGTGVLPELPGLVGSAEKVSVIHPEALCDPADRVVGALREAGHHVFPMPVPDGDAAKTTEVAADLGSRLARTHFT